MIHLIIFLAILQFSSPISGSVLIENPSLLDVSQDVLTKISQHLKFEENFYLYTITKEMRTNRINYVKNNLDKKTPKIGQPNLFQIIFIKDCIPPIKSMCDLKQIFSISSTYHLPFNLEIFFNVKKDSYVGKENYYSSDSLKIEEAFLKPIDSLKDFINLPWFEKENIPYIASLTPYLNPHNKQDLQLLQSFASPENAQKLKSFFFYLEEIHLSLPKNYLHLSSIYSALLNIPTLTKKNLDFSNFSYDSSINTLIEEIFPKIPSSNLQKFSLWLPCGFDEALLEDLLSEISEKSPKFQDLCIMDIQSDSVFHYSMNQINKLSMLHTLELSMKKIYTDNFYNGLITTFQLLPESLRKLKIPGFFICSRFVHLFKHLSNLQNLILIHIDLQSTEKDDHLNFSKFLKCLEHFKNLKLYFYYTLKGQFAPQTFSKTMKENIKKALEIISNYKELALADKSTNITANVSFLEKGIDKYCKGKRNQRTPEYENRRNTVENLKENLLPPLISHPIRTNGKNFNNFSVSIEYS